MTYRRILSFFASSFFTASEIPEGHSIQKQFIGQLKGDAIKC